MLNWVDDIAYRRRTFTQLTRIEHRHRLAGAIRFGHKGKMYEPYREGQEDELNALGLVLNMVVLWNTRYLNAALNYLRQTGFVVREEDIELRELRVKYPRDTLWGSIISLCQTR